MIANKGVEVVLTGNTGPNAFQTLSAAGIQVISGVTGRIRDAIEAYKRGQFQASPQPTVNAHFGIGGMGMGRGMGIGVVIVFSPQELAAMVARKAVKMAQEAMHIPILGVVENMSYFLLPDTGKRIELFGRSKGEEMAKAAEAPLLAQIPIDPELARLCDEGDIEHYDSEVTALPKLSYRPYWLRRSEEVCKWRNQMAWEFDKLEEEIMADMWSAYTKAAIDHAMNPRNVGSMADTDGFGTSIAAGSMVTELARGKAVIEGLRITQQDVLDALGGLPEESVHCALLAASTLKEAIRDYMAFEKEPWKRAYQRH